jgi:molecular chaperone Hsp33
MLRFSITQKKKTIRKHSQGAITGRCRNRLYNFILADGVVRGVIMNASRMVNEMRANHELGILETLALGRAYLGAGSN